MRIPLVLPIVVLCAAISAISLFLAGCNTLPTVKPELRPLYESARAVEGALNVGVSYQDFGALLTRMSTQLVLMEDRAKFSGIDNRERDAAAHDARLVQKYRRRS
jgi:hypothetical protein